MSDQKLKIRTGKEEKPKGFEVTDISESSPWPHVKAPLKWASWFVLVSIFLAWLQALLEELSALRAVQRLRNIAIGGTELITPLPCSQWYVAFFVGLFLGG